jgi:hypothetical protein
MQVVLYDRSTNISYPMFDKWKVNRLYWALPGGSREAELELKEKYIRDNLEQILEGLGKPVDILDDVGQIIWNGLVQSIEIQLGAVSLILSLDQFANRIAIRYIDLKPTVPWSREDGITAFVEDAIMISRFGKKEWIGFLPNGSPGQALNAAQTWLKEKANVQKRLVLNQNEKEKVTYHLIGYWDTLDWIFYKQDGGFVGHLNEGKSFYAFGTSSSTTKIAQKFIVPAGGIKTREVWVRLGKKLLPVDSIIVEIFDDVSGSPGTTVITSGTVGGASLTGGYNWIRFAVGAVTLTAGAAYWLSIRRSGAVSSSTYFMLATDDAMGYAAGDLKVWNGSSWAVRNEDLNFAILGSEETTEQIEKMGSMGGQFLNGVRIKDTSGVQHILWRELRLTCREEIENLLRVGAVDGRKLDAMVDVERNLVVWRRKETVDWRIDKHGKIKSWNGVDWDPALDWLGELAETEFGEVVRLEEWEWRG